MDDCTAIKNKKILTSGSVDWQGWLGWTQPSHPEPTDTRNKKNENKQKKQYVQPKTNKNEKYQFHYKSKENTWEAIMVRKKRTLKRKLIFSKKERKYAKM